MPKSEHGHSEEYDLGELVMGEDTLRLSQAHGAAAAGKELHLIVAAPPATTGGRAWSDVTMRVWIGTADRLASMVERAEYDATKNRFDAHASVPDPVPSNVAWWIEIEMPDGSTQVGSLPVR